MAGTSKHVNRYQETERGHRLVQLVASGATLAEAARRLEIPWKSAQDAFARQMAEVADERTKSEVLQTELTTLGMMQQALMTRALRGDTQASKAVLDIMDRRARYLGLHEAIKFNVQIGQVNGAIQEISEILEGEVVEATPLRRVLPEGA